MKQVSKFKAVGLAAILIVLAALAIFISIPPDNLSNRPVVVISGSMEPAIMTNSVCIIKKCGIDDITIGDVVLYKSPLGINIIHRAISEGTDESGERYLITKGDANEYPDSINITANMVLGRVTETYNSVAPMISKFMESPGKINNVALLQALLVLVVILVILNNVICEILNFILLILEQFKSDKPIKDSLDELRETIESVNIILESYSNNQPKSKVKNAILIAKQRELRDITNSLKDNIKIYKLLNLEDKKKGD